MLKIFGTYECNGDGGVVDFVAFNHASNYCARVHRTGRNQMIQVLEKQIDRLPTNSGLLQQQLAQIKLILQRTHRNGSFLEFRGELLRGPTITPSLQQNRLYFNLIHSERE